MKKFSKLFKVCNVALIGGLAVLATSCGETKDTSHTIVFYHTMGDNLQNVLNTAVEQFEADYPGWKVEHSQIGGYSDVQSKCVATLQAKTQPDLAYCYSDHVAQYLTTQKVVDLSQLVNSTATVTKGDGTTVTVGYSAEELADFTQTFWKEGLASNYANASKYGYTSTAMLTVPYVRSTELLYFNKTILEDCNIAVPTTWDELWAACNLIKANPKYSTMTPLGYDSEGNWFITMCQQNGWSYTTADATATTPYVFATDEAAAWLDSINAKWTAGLVTTQQDYGSYTSALFKKGADGGCAFVIGSSGGASNQTLTNGDEWGIAAVPGTKKADGTVNKSAISQGPSIVQFYQNKDNAITEKETMAWIFTKYLLETDYQCTFSQTSGYSPIRESCYNENYSDTTATYAEWLDSSKITAVAARVASTMRADLFTSPAFNGSSNARNQVGYALLYTMTGEKTGEEALEAALRNCGA